MCIFFDQVRCFRVLLFAPLQRPGSSHNTEQPTRGGIFTEMGSSESR